MTWHESYKLVWKDFQANPDKNSSAVAITVSGITFGFSITQTSTEEVISCDTEVSAHFYPEKSWYKPKSANNHILNHEQLHFDITELHARKFRHEISLIKISNSIENDLKTLQKNINKQLAQMQNLYDEETNHSRNIETQAKWQVYINQEIEKLANYKIVN